MNTSRSIVLLMILTSIIVPMMDQLACDFCGPTPENPMTAKLGNSDEYVMKDDFKRPGSLADGGDAAHIHFCVLHSTSLMLEAGFSLLLNLEKSDYEVTSVFINQTLPDLIYHPPSIS